MRQLVDFYARYLYLTRLQSPDVLTAAISEGLGLFTWVTDSFAYADSYDQIAERYRGLRVIERIPVTADDRGLLVRPEMASQQMEAERRLQIDQVAGAEDIDDVDGPSPTRTPVSTDGEPMDPVRVPARVLKRYHGSVSLNPMQVASDAGRIAEEVIAHLAGLVGAQVEVTLEIEAEIPGGAPEHVVRVVTRMATPLGSKRTGLRWSRASLGVSNDDAGLLKSAPRAAKILADEGRR